jgi:hypothetical protein
MEHAWRKCNTIIVGYAEGKRHSEDPGSDERVILKWILKE